MAFVPDVLTALEADAAEIVARYPEPRSALLPLLHLVQSVDGYITADGIAFCAGTLSLSHAEVSAVATFYTQYKRHPNGRYTLGVCTNTLCAIMGGDEIFDAVSEHLGIGHDETTEDGVITLERIECNAACDYAPVVMANWEFFDEQTPASTCALADRMRAGQKVRPTRGADEVVDFRAMSRVLAGFPDGRADEGVGAGDRTQVGLRLARANGWQAPVSQERDESSTGDDISPEANDAADAADAQYGGDPDEASSGNDAPSTPADTKERAGTTAGKPGADADDTEE